MNPTNELSKFKVHTCQNLHWHALPTDHSGIAIGGNLDLPGRLWSGSAEPKWSKWLCPVHPLWWIVLKWGINPKNGQSARTWGYIRQMMGLIYATNDMVGWCWLLVEVDKLGMYELAIRTWIQHSSRTLNLSSLPQFFWLSWQSLAAADSTCFQTWLLPFAYSKRPWRRAPTRESHQRVPAYRPQCHSDSPAPWALGMPWWPKVGMEVGVALGIADVVGWISQLSPPSVGDVCCLVIFPFFSGTPWARKVVAVIVWWQFLPWDPHRAELSASTVMIKRGWCSTQTASNFVDHAPSCSLH